jgi:hypothetical protein
MVGCRCQEFSAGYERMGICWRQSVGGSFESWFPKFSAR